MISDDGDKEVLYARLFLVDNFYDRLFYQIQYPDRILVVQKLSYEIQEQFYQYEEIPT